MSSPITVHEFPPVIGMQPSPFGLKLETWLKMIGLDYDVEWSPQKMGPKGKVPFATIEGEVLGDTECIIERLPTRSLDGFLAVDEMSDLEKAKSTLLLRLVEEHLYYVMVYSRWSDPKSWSGFKDLFFSPAPALIRGFIARKIQKKVLASLSAQGIGRHSMEDIYKKGATDLRALSVLLGDRLYFHGDKPAVTDASAYGLLANLFYSPIDNDLCKAMRSHANLVAFVERMKAAYWPASKRGGGDQEVYRHNL